MQTLADQSAHQLVPRRMKLNLIPTVPEAIE
jgi:hypothetical protein